MSTQQQKSTASSQEQTYSIQPHPAKTNDPADLTGRPQSGRGLNPQTGAFHAREPHVPSDDVLNSLEQPKTREELHARSAELNSGK